MSTWYVKRHLALGRKARRGIGSSKTMIHSGCSNLRVESRRGATRSEVQVWAPYIALNKANIKRSTSVLRPIHAHLKPISLPYEAHYSTSVTSQLPDCL